MGPTQTCPRCATGRAPSDFGLRVDGRPRGWCKPCEAEVAQQRRDAEQAPRRCRACHELRPLSEFVVEGGSALRRCVSCREAEASRRCRSCYELRPPSSFVVEGGPVLRRCAVCREVESIQGEHLAKQRASRKAEQKAAREAARAEADQAKPKRERVPKLTKRMRQAQEAVQALTEGKKPCRVCSEVKPLEVFRLNASAFDGRDTVCGACRAERQRARLEISKLPDLEDTERFLRWKARKEELEGVRPVAPVLPVVP